MKKIFKLSILFSSFLFGICYAQWQPDFRLTNNPGYSLNSSFDASDNNLHVVWQDYRDNNSEIYYKRSTDNGISFGNDVRLTNNTGQSVLPEVTVSGSNVHVVWEEDISGDYEIFYIRSTDNGATWGPVIRITNASGVSGYAHVAASGSTVHILWRDVRNGSFDLFYKRSIDNGASWSPDSNLVPHNAGALASSAAIISTGSVVYIAWSDTRDSGNYEIYFKCSTTGGISWGPDTRLTTSNPLSERPIITASGDNIHLIWAELNNLTYKRSTNGGNSWSNDTIIAANVLGASNPSIFLSGTHVHFAYTHDPPNTEVFYNHSVNGGISWDSNLKLSNSLSSTHDVHIRASGSAVHMVWWDTRNGSTNSEIYYKRNGTGNTIGVQTISTEMPRNFSLSQNYPNPFNPVTNIKFSIAKSGNVKLVIFDINGREVAAVVNEYLSAGIYKADFDGKNLASGIYFYKILTNEFTDVKKMILVK